MMWVRILAALGIIAAGCWLCVLILVVMDAWDEHRRSRGIRAMRKFTSGEIAEIRAKADQWSTR